MDTVVVVALVGIAGTLLAGIVPRWLDHGAEQRNWTRDHRLARHSAFMTEMNNVLHRALVYQSAINRGISPFEQNAELLALVEAKRDMRNALMQFGLVSAWTPSSALRRRPKQSTVRMFGSWIRDRMRSRRSTLR